MIRFRVMPSTLLTSSEMRVCVIFFINLQLVPSFQFSLFSLFNPSFLIPDTDFNAFCTPPPAAHIYNQYVSYPRDQRITILNKPLQKHFLFQQFKQVAKILAFLRLIILGKYPCCNNRIILAITNRCYATHRCVHKCN